MRKARNFLIFLLAFVLTTCTAFAAPACCEKTTTGLYCQYVDEANCADGFHAAYTSCEQTSYCKPGCCYSTNEGRCFRNTVQRECADVFQEGMTWSSDASCGIEQCKRGCCVIGDQASFVSEIKCKNEAKEYPGVAMTFDENVADEKTCIDSLKNLDMGCCIDSDDKCTFTTRTACSVAGQEVVEGNLSYKQGFYLNMLCSNDRLPCDCAPQQTTGCVEGKEGVYWLDSCGNRENIYDYSNKKDSYNDGFLLGEEEACGSRIIGSASAEDPNCGNCVYSEGTICAKDLNHVMPVGEYTCRNVNCKTTTAEENSPSATDGGPKLNGESWCIYDGPVGLAEDLVGSKHYRAMCINGEEIAEPCKDYREEICVQGELGQPPQETYEALHLQRGSYVEAACRENRWKGCFDCNSVKDCGGECASVEDPYDETEENEGYLACCSKKCCNDLYARDCYWSLIGLSDLIGAGGVCVPQVPPGLKFWGDSETSSATTTRTGDSTCSQGNKECKVIWKMGGIKALKEKYLGGKSDEEEWEGWDILEGKECTKAAWVIAGNNLCKSLGDCGAYKNVADPPVPTVDGYANTASAEDELFKGYDLQLSDVVNIKSFVGKKEPKEEKKFLKELGERGGLWYLGGILAFGAYSAYQQKALNGEVLGCMLPSFSKEKASQCFGKQVNIPAPSADAAVNAGNVVSYLQANAHECLQKGATGMPFPPESITATGKGGSQAMHACNEGEECKKADGTALCNCSAGQICQLEGKKYLCKEGTPEAKAGGAEKETTYPYTYTNKEDNKKVTDDYTFKDGKWISKATTSISSTTGWGDDGKCYKTRANALNALLPNKEATDVNCPADEKPKSPITGSSITEITGKSISDVTGMAFWNKKEPTPLTPENKAELAKQVNEGKLSCRSGGSAARWMNTALWLVMAYQMIDIKMAKELEKTYTITCSSWVPPDGGSDCEECNNVKLKPCSEYKCKSMGKACAIANAGSTNETCYATHPNDVSSPIIEFVDSALLPQELLLGPPPLQKKTEEGNKGVVIAKKVRPFTPIVVKLATNEPAQCKYDVKQGVKFDSMPSYFGSTETVYERTLSISIPAQLATAEALKATNGGLYTIYARCKDANGNANERDFFIRFAVDPSPDLTPPLIKYTSLRDNAFVPAGATTMPFSIYVNEPVDCKWSTVDKDYDTMEDTNTMDCTDSPYAQSSVYYGTYECKTTLYNISLKDNQFFFRCKDKSDNINSDSFKFILKGTKDMNITRVGPTGNFYFNTVTLEAKTSGGAENGKAKCGFSLSDMAMDAMIPFVESDAAEHKQPLENIPTGTYTYYIGCIDAAGNRDKKPTTFTIAVDTVPPSLTKVYADMTYSTLVIETNEVSNCEYAPAQFNWGEGTPMQGVNVTQHEAGLSLDSFNILCKDNFGNQGSFDVII